MKNDTVFDYSALKGKIKEKCGTQANFAQKMGRSNVSISEKLNSKKGWTQEEICRASELLDIAPILIESYFFKQIVK